VGRTVGSVTAFALVLSALYRMLAWLTGDYAAWAGETLRIEAIAFLMVALALVWLRPRPPAQVAS
jgi:succinate dehydrogenase hydrophobic anchor subunit